MKSIRGLALAVMLISLPASLCAQSLIATPEKTEVAHRVVAKMRSVEQMRFALGKMKIVFAQQVIADAASRSPNPLASYVATEAGKAHVIDVLGEEFAKAFEANMPQVEKAAADRLATDLSIEDLRATEVFLDSPAGKSWIAAALRMQSDTSVAGQRAGAGAGTEAVAATFKRLEAESGQSK